MTFEQLYQGLLSLGYPVAYSHFSEGNVPQPPFITYMLNDTENFFADSITYQEINNIYIELYSKTKDLTAEQTISNFLTEKNIAYEKQEYYIESEKMIQVIYYINL